MFMHIRYRTYLWCFPLYRYHTLEPEPAEEMYVELSDTDPKDPAAALSTTYPGKGETYIIAYSFQLACLAVV